MALPDGMTPLFTADDLTSWLGRDVTEGKAATIEQVVWGWLKPALKAETRPSAVPDEVFSWAIELAAIAHENPAGLSSQQLGDEQQAFSIERRNEILREASSGASGGALSPRSNFPPARPYPDPAW